MVQGKIRLVFRKTGKLKFISHLDLIRTMKGAISRAGIPIYYTEGFNPHPKMVFALPLAVGCESECEYLDIKLTREMDECELLERLNGQFPPELRFLKAYCPASEFLSIASAEYIIRLRNVKESEIKAAIESPIVISKKSKKGMVDVDISKNIISYRMSAIDGGVSIDVVLCAKPDAYVNPEHLVKGLSASIGKEIDDYSVMRIKVFDSNGELFV